MDYLNKYVIISLILLLLLFINQKTDTIKEMTGGDIIAAGAIIANQDIPDINNFGFITIHNNKINTISTIAEFSVPFTSFYNIITYFNIEMITNNPSIYLYLYGSMGDYRGKYPIYEPKKNNKSKKNIYTYKQRHELMKLHFQSGDILKIVVPTLSTDIKIIETPVILLATWKTDYNNITDNIMLAKSTNDEKLLKEYKDYAKDKILYIIIYIMLYIITYTIEKDNADDNIIKLSGNNKIDSIIDFCKTKKSNDIICYVNDLDIIIADKKEILDKYYSFNKELIISKINTENSIIKKYIQDKIYSRCQEYNINTDFFIGTAQSIIDLFSKLDKNTDEQIYITKLCNKSNNIKIDTDNILFYNYSKDDDIKIVDKRIVINNQYPAIISFIEKKNNLSINHFKNEILFILINSLNFYYFKNKYFNIFIYILTAAELINHELFIKHIDTSIIYKFIYYLLRILHLFLIYILFNLIYKSYAQPDIKIIILLNISYLLLLLSFFIFRGCILSIIENYVLGTKDIGNMLIYNRFAYFLNKKNNYIIQKNNMTTDWFKTQIIVILVIIISNIKFLINNNLFKLEYGEYKYITDLFK
jgi:hypothetical protein